MHLYSLIDAYALRQDGSEPLTANWDAGPYKITTGRFESNVAIGTAPLVITSTTLVSNLNADLWDGYQFADYLDQAVKVASTPTFAGLISTGVVRATDFAKTGWPTVPGVTLSFVGGTTRTLTVTDVDSAYYYIDGVKYTLGGNKTVTITDTEGLWYIYFVGSTLTASQTIWSFKDEDKALVAILYWARDVGTPANGKEIFLGWEAHTFLMGGVTHARLHYAGGARWESGLLVSDAGSETVNVSAGDIWDEDLNIPITDGAGAALFEQVLSPAELPIYYRDGASAWRIYETTDKANATDAGYVDGSNDLKYNKLNGTWANATVTTGKYVAYYVIATNDQTEPVALIMGQRVDTILADAKENNLFSGLSLTNLPFEEMVILARLILKGTGSGVYYTLEEVLDLRAFNIKGNITSPLITDHGGLGGLGDDDHPQYIKDSEFTQNSGVLVGTANGTFQEETGATLRTSLGLGVSSIVTFGQITSAGIMNVGSTITAVTFTDDTLSINSGSIGSMVNAGMSGELTFTAPTASNIQMGGFGTANLYIEGAGSGRELIMSYFTADGNGTDSCFFHFYAKGTRASLVNTESCAIGYAASLTAMFIETFVGGEGTTLRPIKILTQGNTDQLSIEIDGTNKMLPTYSHTITSNVRDLQIDDAGILGYVAASALKDKTNIRDLEGSEKIYDLRPIRFDRIDGLSIDAVGLIVEEADLVMPEIVSHKTNYITETVEDKDLGPSEIVVGYDRTDIPETVVYSRLIVPMLKEIQILNQRIEQLESVA